ncbi:META domain-containing protein [Gelidibacter japonicus]|uniref:META domain-containing protein n=1 Tax=Gelidibacter japonicus TaxID=1962232 RepID=UPI003A94C590
MKYILSLSFLACILLFNCKSQVTPQKPSTTDEVSFIGTKWVLTKLNGDVLNLSKTELEQPFIRLTAKDNGVGGNGGCNTFGGTYTLKDNQQIEFSQMMATMRYCEGSSIENVFMGNLQKARSYILTDGELTFKDENGYVLASFEPSTEKVTN